MNVKVLEWSGYKSALLGMALSYWDGEGDPTMWFADPGRLEKAVKRSKLLAFKQGGHNKFLESIQIWILIKASRAFWQEFDTYRVGITKQSASTMHTLNKRFLGFDDFSPDVTPETIAAFNTLLSKEAKDINVLKANLPEGFLQTRVVCTNYKVLQNIYYQRHNHRLNEWKLFFKQLLAHVPYVELIVPTDEDKDEGSYHLDSRTIKTLFTG